MTSPAPNGPAAFPQGAGESQVDRPSKDLLDAAAWVWSASIIIVWVLVALSLDQPIWQLQHSRDLVAFGAIRGSDFELLEGWRLFASQWLHVKFPHMLFNALIIGVVGQASIRRNGVPLTMLVGVIGGAIAQFFTLVFNPTAYISGASQAYLALCGLALLTTKVRSVGWTTALLGVMVAAGIDLFISSHGALKVGHVTGFAAGVIAGWMILYKRGHLSGGMFRLRLVSSRGEK